MKLYKGQRGVDVAQSLSFLSDKLREHRVDPAFQKGRVVKHEITSTPFGAFIELTMEFGRLKKKQGTFSDEIMNLIDQWDDARNNHWRTEECRMVVTSGWFSTQVNVQLHIEAALDIVELEGVKYGVFPSN